MVTYSMGTGTSFSRNMEQNEERTNEKSAGQQRNKKVQSKWRKVYIDKSRGGTKPKENNFKVKVPFQMNESFLITSFTLTFCMVYEIGF